jgi:hypothetical protein
MDGCEKAQVVVPDVQSRQRGAACRQETPVNSARIQEMVDAIVAEDWSFLHK